ncbi:hypothetical protein GF391_00055 [Candidatus Uhrbacteria bacterium]|nr:hypothetical protein [Candidatus Uhrbacteria bacterium]
MPVKADIENKQWDANRARLYEFAKKNQAKDFFADQLFAVMTECPLNADCIKKQRQTAKKQSSALTVANAEELSLDSEDLRVLVAAMPGDWAGSIICSCRQFSHKTQSSNKHCVIRIASEALPVEIHIHNTLEQNSLATDIICSGLLHSYSAAYFSKQLSKDLISDVEHFLDKIDTHQFHATHKDLLHKPTRSSRKVRYDKNAALFASILQTTYEAPFYSDKQDWKCATQKALMGMQYIKMADARELVKLLSRFFEEADPQADMNRCIRQYQHLQKSMRHKQWIARMAELFNGIEDEGVKNFVRRWVGQLRDKPDQPVFPPIKRSLNTGSQMAYTDAKELSASLTYSLRLESPSPSLEREAVNALTADIRRFNESWKTLDKSEQKFLRPKLLQIVHSSIV